MQVLFQLLLCSKASSCFRTPAGFGNSHSLWCRRGQVPKYLAIAAWRQSGAGVVRDLLGCSLFTQPPKLCLSMAVWHCGQHLRQASQGITGLGGVPIL